MNNFLNVRHPWFLPLWRRVLVAAMVCGWATFEFLMGEVFWAILFGAAGGWLIYQWFVVFDPRDYQPRKDGNG